MRGPDETHMREARKANLERRQNILERELASVKQEIEDLQDRYIQVIFLIGPDSPEWADDFRDKRYTYADPSRTAVIGDFVVAGGMNGIAQVVGIGKGAVPAYRDIHPITAILERREIA